MPCVDIADGMGRMLSRIHHMAGKDGRGIEFVVGGSIEEDTTFWCMDFNEVQDVDPAAAEEVKVKQLVDAFVNNDPYYPRPGMKYWERFEQSYLEEAPPACRELAERFIVEMQAEIEARNAQAAMQGGAN